MGADPAAGSGETDPTGWQPAKEFDKFRKQDYRVTANNREVAYG